MLYAHLFGGLSLAWHDEPLTTIPSPTARSLFAYLVTHRGRPHTRDLLAGTFWPDLPDTIARRRLSQALWQIRHTLSPHPILLTEGDTVQLNLELPLWIDVEQFTRRKAQGTNGGPEAIVHCELCIEHYTGDFLAGYYDDWVLPERERLREMFLAVLGQLVAGYKSQGEYERALVHARRLAAEDPWREAAHCEVMRLCHLLDRDAEALVQFEACRQALADELDIEPSPETVALAREIAYRGGQTIVLDLPQAVLPSASILLDDPQSPEIPLVGREEERKKLLAHVEALFQGLGGIVLVEGEAGVGKTRLLQAVTSDAEWRGAEVLWANGQESGATMPYGPLLAALSGGLSPLRISQLDQLVEGIWLQVLVAMLPPLAAALPDLPPPPKLEPAQERDRLTAALAQLLAGWAQITPLLLVLEDLHWAGEDALDLLARLAPSLGEQAVLLVGSYRSEEARALPGLWQKIQALDRAGVKRKLDLSGLDAATTGELIRRCLGMGSPASLFESRLYRETQGNPLFVLETLRALHGEGLLNRDRDGKWSTPWDEITDDYAELPLPRAVEQTIARRLVTLPLALEQTIRLAAVLGERFDYALLHAASEEESPTLLAALHSLVQRRFVDETDQDYRFSHDKIRQVAYEGIAAPQRSSLHRQAAEAFETLQPDRVATLAYHWTQAEVWDRAADYHQQAGDRARAVYANAEAAGHYSQALAALERLPEPPDLARAFELRLAREAVYGLQGDRKAQAQDLTALEGLAEALDDDRQRAEVALHHASYAEVTSDYPEAITKAQATVDLAQAGHSIHMAAQGYLKWGRVLVIQGDYEAAKPRIEQALALARAADLSQEEADCLRNLSVAFFFQGDFAKVRAYSNESLEVCSEIGDRQGECESLIQLGGSYSVQGDYGRARTHYKKTLCISREIGDRRTEGRILANIGLTFMNQEDYAEAKTYYEQALHIFCAIGDRWLEGWTIGSLGDVYCYLGDYSRSKANLERCLDILRQVGERRNEGWTLASLGDVSVRSGDYVGARLCYEQALLILREIGNRRGESWALSGLGLVFHHLGDDKAALEYSQQALRITRNLGEGDIQGDALTHLGHAFTGLERLTEAADVYKQALVLRRKMEQQNLALEPLIGLAHISLRQGNLDQALAQVEEVLTYLEISTDSNHPASVSGHTLDGTEEPFRIYLTCYRVLQANQDPRAPKLLTIAHDLLQKRAARIDDEEMRRSFLENVAVHRKLIATYHGLQTHQRDHRGRPEPSRRIQVRLPRADAPTTRPLTPDEWVEVTWTVGAPDDAEIPGKVDRRRHRLLRLLSEAADRAAAPTVDDLAAALQVSRATIKRDLAALRRAGFEPKTRGSRK